MPRIGVVNVGLVNVLLVNVSVVALPTNVSVEVGSVKVPVLTMVAMTGVVSVGLVARTTAPLPVDDANFAVVTLLSAIFTVVTDPSDGTAAVAPVPRCRTEMLAEPLAGAAKKVIVVPESEKVVGT